MLRKARLICYELRLGRCLVEVAVALHQGPGEGRHEKALAGRLGITRRDVAGALGKLRRSGIIGDDGRLDRTVLRRVARTLPQAPPPDPTIIEGPWSADEAEVLRRFFIGGRLSAIPANRTKRLVVLERLAQEFEPGLRYAEVDVNFRLQMFHRDYAALRRCLVDETLLTRADGVYWRSGGRYDMDGADSDVG